VLTDPHRLQSWYQTHFHTRRQAVLQALLLVLAQVLLLVLVPVLLRPLVRVAQVHRLVGPTQDQKIQTR
jgi:hypothetical protein